MTFLAPAALLGLSLLALPVIVHLLRPRKMRHTPFSSLRWLKITRQRLSRRIQWHQWLLFLTRAGLIVLLVLALTKPILGLWQAHGPTDRFIIVDAGRVMGYETKEGGVPFERAREIAARLAERAGPGDRTALVLAGSPSRLLAAPTADPAVHLPKLRAATVQATDAPVSAALSILPTMVGKQAQHDVELVFVTANQRAGWQQTEVQAFAQAYGDRLHVQVIDVGPGNPTNAWIAGARLIERGAGEDLVMRVAIGCTGGAGEARNVRLTGIDGATDDVQEATLTPGRTAHVDFRIPASLPLAGQVAEIRLEPEDALPSDDRYYLNLDMAWALRLLLVEPAPDVPEQPGTGRFLRDALDALARAGNHSLRLTSRSATSVTPADVDHADLAILAGVPKLPDEAATALDKRVRAGAGLIVFLGPLIDVDTYRRQFFHAVQSAEGLLPLSPLAGPSPFKQGGPDELRQIRWSHPLLAPLRDPLLGDLSQSQFLKYAALEAGPSKGERVLARFADDTPALVEHVLGGGRVLLWNTTADDAWSDLPRRRCFVPLVDRMVAYLTAGGVRRQFFVGEPINLPGAGVQSAGDVRVTGPDGATLPARVHTTGTQTILRLDGVDRPGVYRVEPASDSGKAWSFVVNTGRDASPMTPMDADVLEKWWAPAAFELVSGDTALARLEAQSSGWPLGPALILLGGLLLLAETIYVYRLCPRGNPTVVSSVVPDRGIVRPVT
jgi:hypothetical protein